MPMGAFIRLQNGIVKWISCVPERIFRICEHCGYIGHLEDDCFCSIQSVMEEAVRICDELLDMHNVDFAYANNVMEIVP